jgi:hypothetical protein
MPNIFLAGGEALPVRLLDFTATHDRGSVHLQWKTANETNNQSFTIERSKDGVYFTPIYTTPGAGTSTHKHSYSTRDEDPYTGINYYRLKQTDADGKSTYSSIKKVEVAAPSIKLSISPNPVTSSVRLNYHSRSTTLQLIVTTSEGKLMMRLNGSINQLNSQLNNKISSLTPGLYLVQLWDGAQKHNGKIIKH